MATHFLNNSVKKFLNSIADKWNPNGHWRLPSEAYTLEHKLDFFVRVATRFPAGCMTPTNCFCMLCRGLMKNKFKSFIARTKHIMLIVRNLLPSN